MIPCEKKLYKTGQTAYHKSSRISERSKRGMRDASLQNHAQAMQDAKRLREQIRVRAVNAEYTQLNLALGLRRQSKYLPKISKQQTLKSCIAHIKLLRSELSKVIGEQEASESQHLRDTDSIPILQPPLYMPAFPLYIPNLYHMPEVAMENDNTSDVTTFPYIPPYPDNDYDTGMRASTEEDSSLSDTQNNSDTFDSDLSADFPNYTDSFCSTPDSGSSNFSWFISGDWGNLEDDWLNKTTKFQIVKNTNSPILASYQPILASYQPIAAIVIYISSIMYISADCHNTRAIKCINTGIINYSLQ